MGLYLGKQIGEKDSEVLHEAKKHINLQPQIFSEIKKHYNKYSFGICGLSYVPLIFYQHVPLQNNFFFK